MNFIIYITYHDEASYQKALSYFKDQSWARLIQLPNQNNIYLENELYLTILNTRKDEWAHCDFVGAISYQTYEKIGHFDIPLSQHADKDLIAFYTPR